MQCIITLLAFLLIISAPKVIATRLCPNCSEEYLQEDGVRHFCEHCGYYEDKDEGENDQTLPGDQTFSRGSFGSHRSAVLLQETVTADRTNLPHNQACSKSPVNKLVDSLKENTKSFWHTTVKSSLKRRSSETTAEEKELKELLEILYSLDCSSRRPNRTEVKLVKEVEALVESFDPDTMTADEFLLAHNYTYAEGTAEEIAAQPGYYILTTAFFWIPMFVGWSRTYIVINRNLVYWFDNRNALKSELLSNARFFVYRQL